MPVREFELFHGVILTKLVRNDRPLTLRLIETSTELSWAAYKLNAEVTLVMKSSSTPRALKRESGTAWTFNFGPSDLAQLQLAGSNGYVALACGSKKLDPGKMEVCFLRPDQVSLLLDTSSSAQQAVTVKALPRKQLRVSSGRVTKELLVPQNALETWELPGS